MDVELGFLPVLLRLWVAILTLTSCSSKDPGPPYRAKVIALDSDGAYHWKVVDFKYLENLSTMSGKIADIVGDAAIHGRLAQRLNSREDPDEDNWYTYANSKPGPEYEVHNGVVYPLDFDTLSMLSIYHGFEQIYDFLIDNFGFTIEELGKSQIFYDPTLTLLGDGIKIEVQTKSNAAFFPETGDFLVFKTDSSENLPIKLNLEVLAHEFAHKVFHKLFADNKLHIRKSKNKRALEQLRGIDEGLADFAAFVFTGLRDILSPSLPAHIQARERTIPVPWTSRALQKSQETLCLGQYYCKGSVLASALFLLAKSGVGSKTVQAAVYQAIPNLRLAWNRHREDDNFDYYYLLAAIIQALPARHHAKACTIFMQRFDDPVNRAGLRAVCDI